jgi:lipoate-protein ligase A
MRETWLLMDTGPGPAAWNMALDDALLRFAPQRDRALLRVYSWDRPSVSIGYFQKFPAHLADTHDIVRRPTGGGLVYHVEDTTYTVVAPPGHWLHTMSTGEAYCALHKAVAAALHQGNLANDDSCHGPQDPADAVASRAYECFTNPVAGDVVDAGRKLAGAAQRRTREGMLHQGSIAARVSLPQLLDGFAAMLEVGFDTAEPELAVVALADKLVAERYGLKAWTRRVS